MRKLFVSVFALLLVGAVASCGASGGTDTTEKTTTSSKAPGDDGDETTTTEKKSGGDDDEDAYVAAVAKGLTDDQDDGDFVFEKDAAECIAPEWVDIIGVDTFRSKRVKPADLEDASFKFSSLGLDRSQASDMIEATEGCDVDLESELLVLINDDLDSVQKSCLASELDDGTIGEVLEQSIYRNKPTSELQAELDRIDATCQLSDDEPASSGTVPAPTPVTPGG